MKNKIFICHKGKINEQIHELVTMLEKMGYDIMLIEEAESEDNIIKIMDESADILLCIFGDETISIELLDRLIKEAAKKDKQIIGTYYPENQGGGGVPESFNIYGDSLPSWNIPKIRRAIEGEAIFESPNGNPRPHIADTNQGESCK